MGVAKWSIIIEYENIEEWQFSAILKDIDERLKDIAYEYDFPEPTGIYISKGEEREGRG